MKHLGHFVPALAFAGATLSGCSGNGGANSPSIVPAAIEDAAASTALSASGRTPTLASFVGAKHVPYLYVAIYKDNTIYVYPERGHGQTLLGTITAGLSTPEGLYVADDGDLYVSNGTSPTVPVFHHGQKTPYETLGGFSEGSSSVAVDPKGTAYVASGKIYVFTKGSTSPTSTLKLEGRNYPGSLATDSKGDLFVQTSDFSGNNIGVSMFPAGSKKSMKLPISTLSAGGIGVDADDALVVCDAGLNDGFEGSIAIYAPPYTHAGYQKQLFIGPSACTASRTMNTSWAAEGRVVKYSSELHRLDAVTTQGGFTIGLAAD